jgi:hypothetical protein
MKPKYLHNCTKGLIDILLIQRRDLFCLKSCLRGTYLITGTALSMKLVQDKLMGACVV